jgi:hypothetical protein
MACLKLLLNEKLGLSALYPNNIIHLMSTAAVLPLSRAEVERVFSQVKLVKNSRAMPPGGLSKLRPLDSRHRQPIRIVLLYVCWRVENGSAQ